MDIKKLIKETAEELNISPKVVEEVWKHQFRFVRKEISNVFVPLTISLPFFGRFQIYPSRVSECCNFYIFNLQKGVKTCMNCGKECESINKIEIKKKDESRG